MLRVSCLTGGTPVPTPGRAYAAIRARLFPLAKNLPKENPHVLPGAPVRRGVVSDASDEAGGPGHLIGLGIGEGVDRAGVIDELVVEFSIIERLLEGIDLFLLHERIN